MQPGSREFKEKLDSYLTTEPAWRTDEYEELDEDDFAGIETEELKRRVRRALGDLQVAKDHNDAQWMRRAKATLQECEAELAKRRRQRKRQRGILCHEPKEVYVGS